VLFRILPYILVLNISIFFLFHLVSKTFSTKTVPVAVFFTHDGSSGLQVSLTG